MKYSCIKGGAWRDRRLRRAGEALRLRECENFTLDEIGRRLPKLPAGAPGREIESPGRPVSRERARQMVSLGQRVRGAMGRQIAALEVRLVGQLESSAAHHLAHARSELSMFQFHVAANDLDRVEELLARA